MLRRCVAEWCTYLETYTLEYGRSSSLRSTNNGWFHLIQVDYAKILILFHADCFAISLNLNTVLDIFHRNDNECWQNKMWDEKLRCSIKKKNSTVLKAFFPLSTMLLTVLALHTSRLLFSYTVLLRKWKAMSQKRIQPILVLETHKRRIRELISRNNSCRRDFPVGSLESQ